MSTNREEVIDNASIQKEIVRLRKALEFYANEFNYAFAAENIRKDYGKIAREALNNGEALHGNSRR